MKFISSLLVCGLIAMAAIFLKQDSSESNVSEQPSAQNMTTCIGWNGYCFRTDLVEEAFAELSKYWETQYFEGANANHPSVWIYQFRVYQQKNPELTQRRLTATVRNIAERALAKRLHNYGIFTPVDDFIAVNLSNDILKVAIAKDARAFPIICRLRRQNHA